MKTSTPPTLACDSDGAATPARFIDQQAVRWSLLVFVVFSQLATIVITWPLWFGRNEGFVNLPVFDTQLLTNAPFGWLMLAGLLAIPWAPRSGVVVHLALYVLACLGDQFRMQPQFICQIVLMFAIAFPKWEPLGRWYLIAMWFWAGMHKLISADWFGYRAWELLLNANVDPEGTYLIFAWIVIVTEIVLGFGAIFIPRISAFLCLALHLGIFGFMLASQSNFSVFPWNLTCACVGFWLLYRAADTIPRTGPGWTLALFLLVTPAAFYFGALDRCFAHVLYSGHLPEGTITFQSKDTKGQPKRFIIGGYSNLEVPFPKERRLIKHYFELTSSEGDKLHIDDPRKTLGDQFFVHRKGRAVSISWSQFFENDSVRGLGVEDRRSLFYFLQNKVRMLKRSEEGYVYAIAFDPQTFAPEMLTFLPGLPNLEQVQLSGCNLTNDDLKWLGTLHNLTGIGIDQTNISKEGLAHLKPLKNLNTIQCRNSQLTDDDVQQFLNRQPTN